MNNATLKILSKHLTRKEMVRLRNAAADVMGLEYKWAQKLERKFQLLDQIVINHLVNYGELPPESEFSFDDFYMEHSVQVMRQGFETAYAGLEKVTAPPETKRLAKKPVPRSLGELMRIWDMYRKRKQMPTRQKRMAEKVRKAYLKRIRSIWERHSQGFVGGSAFDQVATREALQKASRATYARAKMIVETETTHYYNQARKEVYDASPDVTHYLFLAIRDHATTHWCKTRNGVVFTKGTALFEKNVPPCHWNCRSEILPLTMQNPRHRALILNLALRAEKRALAPLPPGWNNKAA